MSGRCRVDTWKPTWGRPDSEDLPPEPSEPVRKDWSPQLLAVDPGKLTGYVVGDADRLDVAIMSYLPADEFLDWTWDTVQSGLLNIHRIAVEGFDVSVRTLKTQRGDRQWSLEQIGALRWMARRHDLEFVSWRPVQTIRMVTDERLKALRIYKPGKDHPRDAARQYVYDLARRERVRIPTEGEGTFVST